MAEINAFALLGQPVRFALDEEALEAGWRKAIAAVHPDKFAARPAAERRVAEQWAGRINEAKEALTSPVSRAVTLLKMHGVDAGVQTDTRMDGAFLMQQMLWREMAEDATSEAKRAELLAQVDDARQKEIAILTQALDVDSDWAVAREAVRRLMFIEKLRRDILSDV